MMNEGRVREERRQSSKEEGKRGREGTGGRKGKK